MGKVHLLDELTANQIAAGEVIERPVSVVKELVENALDAGATSISVDLRRGGLALIRVTDNGCGMSGEDALLAVKRHATSKLRIIDDLNELKTLGFRGEALPSIAAVAKMEVITREEDSDFGTKIRMEGNNLVKREPVGSPVGTTITVTDLFFNTPARKKFMRSEGYEGGLIHELMIQFSLGHPRVNFRLRQHGKEILNTTGINSLFDLVKLYYGNDINKALIPLDGKFESIFDGKPEQVRVEGFLTLPTYHRVNRKGIHFFINNRRVLSKELHRSLDAAYENALPKGRFPLAVLHITLHPSLVDVNVHPGKLEIRFRDLSIPRELSRLIKENLYRQRQLPNFSLGFDPTTLVFEKPEPPDKKNRDLLTPGVQETWPQFYTWGTGIPEDKSPGSELASPASQPFPVSQSLPLSKSIPAPEPQPVPSSPSPPEHVPIDDGFQPGVEATPNEQFLPDVRIIGQLAATFILAEGDSGLYIIDQHAAHERIIFDRLQRQAAAGKIDSQLLLTPLTLKLTALEEEIVIEHILPLVDMGIILEHFGQQTYLLRAVPACLEEDPRDFINELLHQLGTMTKKLSPADIRHNFLIVTSCKSAVKARQKLSLQDMEQLVRDLRATANPLTCPHGRPIVHHLPYRDLLKAFRRH